MINKNQTCLTNILNNKIANYTKIKEKNEQLKNIKDGAVLITGKHNVNNHSIDGIYLVTFNNKVVIDNTEFENPTGKILNYLREGKFKNFYIKEYIESEKEHLKLRNINILNQFKQEMQEKQIWWSFTTILLTLLFIYILCKSRKNIKIRAKLKNENSKETLINDIALRIQNITDVHSMTVRFDLEEGELIPSFTRPHNGKYKQIS